MSNYLMAFATNWNAKVGKKCHFQALLPDGTKLPLLADTNDIEPFYKVPDTAAEVTLTATPADSPSPYWPTTVTLTNGATGLTAKAGSEGFVRLQTMQFPWGDIGNKAFIFLSRFKDATQTAVNLLANAPTPDDLTYHRNNWAGWPPGDWGLPKLTAVPFIDPNTPVMKSGALNFAPSDLVVQTTSMVLQLAGVDAPQLFSVAWPNAIKPAPGVAPVPMPFLVFLEQTLTTNSAGTGLFVRGAAYPNNFDYADMLYQQTHYADDGPFFDEFAKGVPYQVAKAGASVVTVAPLNSVGIEYGVIMPDDANPAKGETEVLGQLLLELQAFMYRFLSVPNVPDSLGKTAIAAFSSATHVLHKWLQSPTNRGGDFLKNTVKAVYFLDPTVWPRPFNPPELKDYDANTYMASALTWAENPKITGRRIRLYMRDHSDAHALLLGTYDETKGTMVPVKSVPSIPYVKNSVDGLRTAAELHQRFWIAPLKEFAGRTIALGNAFPPTHHLFAATLLTHALAQKDLSSP
jgi:hypothetical protein